MTDSSLDSFPRQHARTRGFRLGAPRALTPSPDGRRVAFLRSGGGSDPVTRLWVLDVGARPGPEGSTAGREGDAAGSLQHGADAGTQPVERCVVDPVALLAGGPPEEDLPAEERARRERLREVAGGITAIAVDREVRTAAFALSGRPFVVALDDPGAVARELPAPGPVVDPRPDPTGAWVAYASGGGLHAVSVATGVVTTLAEAEGPDVTWGLADFIAAEELERYRGFWWLRDGSALLVERVDTSPVDTWWIADPAAPSQPARAHRYPAAGTANAAISLWLVDLDGTRRALDWDHDALPYLATVQVPAHGEPVLSVLSRDQRRQVVLGVDPGTASVTILRERTDPCWVDVVPGAPTRGPDGRLLEVVADQVTDTHRVLLDDVAVSPAGLQVRAVADVGDDAIVVQATDDPLRDRAYLVTWDGSCAALPPDAGVSAARRAGGLVVTTSSDLDRIGSTTAVWRDVPLPGSPIGAAEAGTQVAVIASLAETPVVRPRPRVHLFGPQQLRTAVLLPTGHVAGSGRLPVVLSPYGGPHHQEVLAAGLSYGTDQWIADQGFAVVVADGRGTPGRGPAWERAVYRDLAGPVLADQLAALTAAVAAYPDDLDASRVGIRGWSFGGYLAALAVLLRPDAVHAAVAGAPVTEWRLYDTAYTERYLGDPREDPGPYDACSLIPLAPRLRRPLMIVHGLSDDNVVVAHTLALSGALLAAGRAHSVLPLSGVTHMTPQEVVAENLLRLEVDFLRAALASPS